jgi:hypothetical protein
VTPDRASGFNRGAVRQLNSLTASSTRSHAIPPQNPIWGRRRLAVVDAVKVPVVAAGGIADGAGWAAGHSSCNRRDLRSPIVEKTPQRFFGDRVSLSGGHRERFRF